MIKFKFWILHRLVFPSVCIHQWPQLIKISHQSISNEEEKFISDMVAFVTLRFVVLLSIAFASSATIAIFGGSGKTGSECVFQALNSGVDVVTLVRNPDKLRIPLGSGGQRAGQLYIDLEGKDKEFPFPGKLTVITGDVTNPGDVDFVFQSDSNIDSVIIALGGRTKDVGLTMLTNGTNNIVNSMVNRNLMRVAVITSVGAGDSIKQAPWSFWILMMTVMRNIMADKNNQEAIFLSPNGIGHNLE